MSVVSITGFPTTTGASVDRKKAELRWATYIALLLGQEVILIPTTTVVLEGNASPFIRIVVPYRVKFSTKYNNSFQYDFVKFINFLKYIMNHLANPAFPVPGDKGTEQGFVAEIFLD